MISKMIFHQCQINILYLRFVSITLITCSVRCLVATDVNIKTISEARMLILSMLSRYVVRSYWLVFWLLENARIDMPALDKIILRNRRPMPLASDFQVNICCLNRRICVSFVCYRVVSNRKQYILSMRMYSRCAGDLCGFRVCLYSGKNRMNGWCQI